MDDRQQSKLREGQEPAEPSSVLLTRCWNDGEASIIRQLLGAYGIPCQLSTVVAHTLFPIGVDTLGEIRILVPPAWLDEARRLMAEHRRSGLRLILGGKYRR